MIPTKFINNFFSKKRLVFSSFSVLTRLGFKKCLH